MGFIWQQFCFKCIQIDIWTNRLTLVFFLYNTTLINPFNISICDLKNGDIRLYLVNFKVVILSRYEISSFSSSLSIRLIHVTCSREKCVNCGNIWTASFCILTFGMATHCCLLVQRLLSWRFGFLWNVTMELFALTDCGGLLCSIFFAKDKKLYKSCTN